MRTFGDNLKSLRTQMGLSQKTFADRMQTSQQRVSEWECDKVEPSLFNIMKMLKVLDITFEELTEDIDV